MATVMGMRALFHHQRSILGTGAVRRTCTTTATSVFSFSSSSSARKLVLYSKKECCLCHSLKEKLQIAFMLSGTERTLADVELEVRDITTNPEWEEAYKYQIPVLARVFTDGSEEILPRMSPRISPEQVHNKLAAWLYK